MAHTQKLDFIFRRNGHCPFKSEGGVSSVDYWQPRCAPSAVVMLDTPCSKVVWSGTGYPLHSPVSPSLPLPCVTVCHHISAGLYTISQRTHLNDTAMAW